LVDDLAAIVVAEGNGSFIIKAGIQAYTVHPDDQQLLGISCSRALYIGKVLPFGHRSAPKIFSAVADALLWILNSRSITKGLHYLDNLVLVSNDHHKSREAKTDIAFYI